jgi:hypothetical protein
MDPQSVEPCPGCGKKGTKLVDKHLQGRVAVTATVDRARIRTLLKFNWWAVGVLLIVAVAQPLLCLALPRIPSIVVGGALSLLGLVIGFFAMVKTREIERHI